MQRTLLLLTALLAPLAHGDLEKLADGYRFTEGPVAMPDGAVFFTDIPNNHILRYDPVSGDTTIARTDSGGANGLALDPTGRLIACEGRARQVTRLNPDGSVTVLASEYDGKKLNSPNDLAIDEAGGIYFTDPRYGKRDNMELPEAVYFLATDGTLTQVISDLVRPNGIVLSPNGRVLYVADNGANKVYAYDVAAPGILKDKRLFADLPEVQSNGPDGMSVDGMGNLYVTQHTGDIYRYAPEGFEAGVIDTPGRVTNCVATDKWLYITAQDPATKSWGLWRTPLSE